MSHEELIERIAPYDALIVRSATKVDKAVIDAASNLKIIGRAGVTVDNIDVECASDAGVIVCNAPTSNIGVGGGAHHGAHAVRRPSYSAG